jgi:type II secretory pathway pseudopilin PulG
MSSPAAHIQARLERLPEPFRQGLARLGWPGAVAALLSLLAMLALLWFLPAQERALEQQREQLMAQRQGLKQQQLRRELQSPLRFVSSFPQDSERQARTAALLALATELGLPWPRSEFRYAAEPGLGLAQYRIAMNVNGNYDQIRRYVGEALRLDPALSLELIKLRRLQPGAPELAAELSWVLHMQVPRTLPTPQQVASAASAPPERRP